MRSQSRVPSPILEAAAAIKSASKRRRPAKTTHHEESTTDDDQWFVTAFYLTNLDAFCQWYLEIYCSIVHQETFRLNTQRVGLV